MGGVCHEGGSGDYSGQTLDEEIPSVRADELAKIPPFWNDQKGSYMQWQQDSGSSPLFPKSVKKSSFEHEALLLDKMVTT